MPGPGDRLADRYRILAPLGSGGMATVHRAHDERLDRDVAIKILLPNLADDPATARRFEQEARAMAAVAHPGLVAVFDVEPGDPAAGAEPFVVMELCSGGSLAARLGPDRPMPPDELVAIVAAVADALFALHQAGLVHRDVKPSNILFTADRVKLGDFGLAQSGSEAADLTEPGTAIGTLAYLAPERLRGERGGPAVDVYALATVAHLGLTGSLPRPTDSIRDVVAAAAFRAPPVSSAAPGLGPFFDEAMLAGLAIDPGRRPDALAFAAGLTTALGAWSRAGRPGRETPPRGATGPADATAAAAGLAGARPEPADAALDDEQTTAIAIPVDATAAFVPGEPTPPAAPTPSGASPARPRSSLVPVALLSLVAAAILVTLAFGVFGRPPAAGPSTSPGVSSILPSPSGSPAPASPSPAPRSPSPTANPALAALDAVDAAIAAARGGPDGLKGKEANELESLAARVRRDLVDGDRSKALEDARALDRKIRDLSKKLPSAAADRLRAASADLLAALGG